MTKGKFEKDEEEKNLEAIAYKQNDALRGKVLV
jgi:hypothetical protein